MADTPGAPLVPVMLFLAAAASPQELDLRIAKDAAPAREQLRYVQVEQLKDAKTPQIELVQRADEQVLEMAWGELGPSKYRLDLVGAVVADGVARVTVRAENARIFIYSGPGIEKPRLAVVLPPVKRVQLHIERVGVPLAAGEKEFEPQTGEQLSVTVDRQVTGRR